MSKVFLLGLDGAPPQFVFERWIDSLPNLSKLMKKGGHAKMQTAKPTSTVVAWTSMFSVK